MNNPQKIFHSPEVRVVEASAGSGKTYALAKRYVQIVLNPALKFDQIPIRNILALTFTNKAAFEMKERILEYLKKIVLNQLPPAMAKDMLGPLSLKPDEAKAKALQVMETIIENYNFFQVQTIDKFVNALLAGCAFKIGLTAGFRIKTNSREYLEYSLDELINQASKDPQLQKMFQSFLHNYLYVENRTGWFPKEDMLMIIAALFAQHNTFAMPFKASPHSSEEILKKKKVIIKEMRHLQENLPSGMDLRFVNALEGFLDEHPNGFDIDHVSSYFEREELPLKKDATALDSVHPSSPEASGLKRRGRRKERGSPATPDFVRKLAKTGEPGEAKGESTLAETGHKTWARIHHLLKELCEEEAKTLFNPYIDVFEHVQKNFLKKSQKDDVLFLEELNKRAGELFDEDYITVEELYYRLATRFRHYMIDEFQDTSLLQWHNLEKMAEEALSTGGTFFYVGDKKQAIYSFRGGEVALFDALKDQFKNFSVSVETLSQNWRSQKTIVEFNNQIFSLENLRRFIREKEDAEDKKNKKGAVLLSEDDFKVIAQVFEGSHQKYLPENSKGHVHFELIDIEKREDRDEVIRQKLITLIKDLHARFAYQDIAILTRGNQEVEEMTNWLLEEGISVESERTSDIKLNALIEELVSFLKFLDSPVDNLAFGKFILGEIFTRRAQLPKEELPHFVFKARERLHREKDLYLYMVFREHYPQLWKETIEEFFKNVGLYPLYELVVSIYHRLHCLENFSHAQGFLMHFLELVKKAEDEHADIASFLEYFENLKGEALYVKTSNQDAVKILTIHKSKGLEFPVVILPFFGFEVQVGSSSEGNQQSYILKKDPPEISLLRIKTKYLPYSDELYEIYSEEYKKTFLSELNNAYVALTRAKSELYGFIPKKIGNSTNLVKFLIPSACYQSGQPGEAKPSNSSAEESGFKIPLAEYHDWIDYLKDEFMGYNELRNRPQRLKGEVIHFVLSKIVNLPRDNKKEVISQALDEAQIVFSRLKDWDSIEKAVRKLMTDKALEPFFLTPQAQVYTEKEVVNKHGHTRRIDRLIVTNEEVWIVDFKSSSESQESYIEQVREYMNVVAPLYPKKTVKGFLVYLDSLEVEEVK